MDKQKIIKYGKKFGIIVGSSLIVLFLYALSYWIYWDYYIPNKCAFLCNEAYTDINKADEIAVELMFNDDYAFCDSHNKAIDILINAARKGRVSSAVLLGRYYKGYNIQEGFTSTWRGNGKEDLEKCSYWYLQAAQKGNAEAQGELGHNYKYGIGVQQDFNKAIYWLKLGAKGGNSVAQWRLGNIYLNGLALYNIDFFHINYWYIGDGEFRSLDDEKYQVKNSYLKEILNKPTKVFLKSNIIKAKYYWKLAASQGLQEAKDALEKVYD